MNEHEIRILWKRLRKYPNVIGFDTCLRPKIKAGKEYPNILSIRIFVVKKVPMEEVIFKPTLLEKIRHIFHKSSKLYACDLVPSFIAGIPTDLVVTGEIKALGGEKARYRPVIAGISGCHRDCSACTISAFFLDEKGKKVLIGLNNHCLIKGVRVLSFPSFTKVEETKLVLGSKGQPQEVKKHFTRQYSGKIININFRGRDIGITPEHPVLVKRPKKIYKYPYREYPEYDITRSSEWIQAQELRKYDLLIVPKMKTEETPHCTLEEAFWYGMFVAEGSVGKSQTSKRICIDNQKKQLLERLQSVFGGQIKEEQREEGTLYRLVINKTKLANDLLSQFGGGAHNKHLPDWVFQLPQKHKESFLKGYIAGDGSIQKNRISMKTASEQLHNDLIFLLITLGILPYSSVQEGTSEWHGYRKKCKVYNIGYTSSNRHRYFEDNDYFYVPIYKIEERYYDGPVFNLNTEDNTYCIPFIVHNCGSLENQAKVGDPWLQPSPYDSGKYPEDVIAKLHHFVEIKFNDFTCPYRNFFHKAYKFFTRNEVFNTVDISFGELLVPFKLEAFNIPNAFKGWRDPEINEEVQKNGRTTGYTKGKVISTSWVGQVRYKRGTATFKDCILVEGEGFSAPGDSGSPTFSIDGNLVGILFAGSSSYTVLCKIGSIEKEGKVKVVVR